MNKNFFTRCEKSLTDKDFRLVEEDLSITIPEAFKNIYLICNGGTPKNTVWNDPKGEWDYIEVRDFLAMRYFKDKGDDPDFTIEGTARKEWAEQTLPPSLLPFAIDWGGNYICINHQTGEIFYFVRDVWSNNISVEKSFEANTRYVAKSINEFVDGLVLSEE